MLPDHQCSITSENIQILHKEEEPVVYKLLDNGFSETRLLAPGNKKTPAKVLHPNLGTKPRQTEWQDNTGIEYIFESTNVQMEMYKFQLSFLLIL